MLYINHALTGRLRLVTLRLTVLRASATVDAATGRCERMPEHKQYGEPPYTVTVDGKREPGTFPTQARAIEVMTRLHHKYPDREVVVLDAGGNVAAKASNHADEYSKS